MRHSLLPYPTRISFYLHHSERCFTADSHIPHRSRLIGYRLSNESSVISISRKPVNRSQHHFASNLRTRSTAYPIAHPSPSAKKYVFTPWPFPPYFTKVHAVCILLFIYTILYSCVFRRFVFTGSMWSIEAILNKTMHATYPSSLEYRFHSLSESLQGANDGNIQVMNYLSTQDDENESSTAHQSTAANGKDLTKSSQHSTNSYIYLPSTDKSNPSQPEQNMASEKSEKSARQGENVDEPHGNNWNFTAITDVNCQHDRTRFRV